MTRNVRPLPTFLPTIPVDNGLLIAVAGMREPPETGDRGSMQSVGMGLIKIRCVYLERKLYASFSSVLAATTYVELLQYLWNSYGMAAPALGLGRYCLRLAGPPARGALQVPICFD